MNWPKVLLVVLFPLTCSAAEYIESFHSDITIHHDGSMTVTETIDIVSELRQFKHGLLREFPTHYKDAIGTSYKVFFTLHSAAMNNDEHVPTRIENWRNGKRIYIGYPDRFLQPGPHRFLLTYKTNRQLGYFNEHDELYWNVTGNGWAMPIKQASATVHLPKTIKPQDIKEAAFTGFYGARSSDYTATIKENTVNFITTKPLAPHQGLTIVVGWPKGFITEPNFWTKITWFFADNTLLLTMILAFLGIFYYFWWALQRVRSKKPTLAIIPLFEPPAGISAALMRAIVQRKADSKAFACQIVEYALQELLTIEYNKQVWSSFYTITKKNDSNDPIFNTIFNKQDSLKLSGTNANLQAASQKFVSTITKESGHYYYYRTDLMIAGFILAAIPIIIGAFISTGYAWLGAIPLFIAGIYMPGKLYEYTPRGYALLREIEGFKLFLTTAEIQRYETIGTPPVKTPELWERYLSYAMALDVEKQWSAQFAPVFAQLEKEGRIYQPRWFIGPRFSPGWYTTFANDLSSSFGNAISSSSYIPGSTSGFGKGGRSGGGGGGGGGGGW